MVTSVYELDLPMVDTTGLGREVSLDLIADARKQSWLARTPLGFSISRQEDAVSLLRDRRFHNALSLLRQMNGMEPDADTPERRRSILAMEGEDHARLRRLVAPAFTPAAADRLRPFMREVIGDLVDTFSSTGRCEAVLDLCEPYPIPIICQLFGAPKEDWRRFSAWATDIFRIFNQNLAEDLPLVDAANTALEAYIADLIAARRSTPGDDLLSVLIAIEEEGDRLSNQELVSLAVAVLMAGTDTTRNQLGCALALFAEYPAQWSLLAERPELAPRAVEETMRYLGAVRGTVRVTPEDVVFRDVLFPKGTLVSVSLAGANRDPDVYDGPDTFDITVERDHPADDLRVGHPPLHGCRPRPRRAPGGPDAALAAACPTWPSTGPSSGSRPPSASGDPPGSPCASPPRRAEPRPTDDGQIGTFAPRQGATVGPPCLEGRRQTPSPPRRSIWPSPRMPGYGSSGRSSGPRRSCYRPATSWPRESQGGGQDRPTGRSGPRADRRRRLRRGRTGAQEPAQARGRRHEGGQRAGGSGGRRRSGSDRRTSQAAGRPRRPPAGRGRGRRAVTKKATAKKAPAKTTAKKAPAKKAAAKKAAPRKAAAGDRPLGSGAPSSAKPGTTRSPRRPAHADRVLDQGHDLDEFDAESRRTPPSTPGTRRCRPAGRPWPASSSDRRRVPVLVGAVAVEDLELVGHLGRLGGEEVAGVGVAGDEPERLPLAAAADQDRRAGDC